MTALRGPARRALARAACLALAIVALAPAFAPAGTLEDIERRGVLRLGLCDEDYPPFSFRGADGWEGYDLDLARALAGELGVRLEVLPHPDWDGVVDMVRDGAADIGMSSLNISAARARKVAFSNPYFRLRQGVLANQIELLKIPGETNLDKIRSPEAVIAVRKNSVYSRDIRNFLPDARVVELPTYDECYELARAGGVTGAIGDEMQLLRWLGRVKGDSMRLAPVVFEGRGNAVGIAAPADDPRFLSYVNTFLELRRYTGTVQELYWRYRPPESAVESPGGDGGVAAGEYPPLVLALALAAGVALYLVVRASGSAAGGSRP